MKYTETDLTEATKLVSYLRSVQKYALVVLLLSILYFGFRFYGSSEHLELYILSFFTGVMIVGSLSIIIRLNHTAIIYGFSCIVAGAMFIFSLVYYLNTTPVFLLTICSVIGLLVIRHGVNLVFGKRSQDIFSRTNQKKILFVKNLIKSLEHSLPNEKNVIHGTYTDGGERRNLKIKFLDDIACFLPDRQSFPIFFDRSNVFMFELQDNRDFLHVSIVVENHNWLEADLKPDDFKKYQSWKDL